MIFGSIIIFSPIQDFPYSFLLNSAAEPDRQQPISFAPDIQAFRFLLSSQNLSGNSFLTDWLCLALFFRRLQSLKFP